MKVSRAQRFAAAVVILLLSTGYAFWQHGYFSGQVTSDGSFRVAQVVDGDTIRVNESGKVETVRFLGINTPETVDPRKPVQCFGHEASAKMHQLLDRKRVILEAAAGREDRDIYGRQLRYVELQDGTDVNLLMIKEGFAHEYTFGSLHPRTDEYRAAETEAKAAKRGLWADPKCAAQSAQKKTRAR